MALTLRERFEFPDLWRRFFEPDMLAGWMRVEEFTDGDTMVIRAELPGIDPDRDVELTITEGVLHVRAVRHETSEDKAKDRYHSEFRYGSFERSLALPAGTKEEEVKASYTNGILEVRVPLGEAKTSSTKVPVTRG
ncbi:MAG TPA: Hsp20/alpha crystallin family protein [Acidimicrobiales bacterium]|nr:Hsp20/alpha crystallin family protein [Acidimicrobiales bacterium]